LGWGHFGLGNLTTAKEHFETALRLDANHPGVTLHYRMLHQQGEI